MPVSIFDMPHLLELIATHLPRKDVINAALVCYSWSRVIVPLSWRHFKVGQIDYAALIAQPDLLKIFADRAPTVQSLTVRCSSTLSPLVEYLQERDDSFSYKLTRLFLECDQHMDPLETLISFSTALGDRLQHLHVTTYQLQSVRRRMALRVQQSFIDLRSLRAMTFQCHSEITGCTLAVLLRYCPESLEFLRIDSPMEDNHDAFWDLVEAVNNDHSHQALFERFWHNAPPTNIRTLQVPGSVRRNGLMTIVPFLRYRCPKLTTLGPVPTMGPANFLPLGEALRDHCSKLENLEFHDLLMDMLPLYTQVIMACHALKSLTISGKVYDGRDVVQAAVQYHARTLTRVRWTGDGGFNSGMDMEEFLLACPSLERVETTYGEAKNFFTGQGATGAMRIKSKALATPSSCQPSLYFWACHATLTHLDVTFCPQGDISQAQEFRDQIDLTYRKLGQLCALVELRLGCRCRCDGPTLVRCSHFRHDAVNGAAEIMDGQSAGEDDVILNMSLESGLGHLAGLKRLRVLSIARIQGHRVGYAELEWMREHWRQLHGLFGVRNTRIVEWVQREWAGVQVSYLDVYRAVEVAM